jgi:hypothetical protein
LPALQDREQQSPKLVQESPVSLHVVDGPPQTFFTQLLLQHSETFVQDAPFGLQVGATQVPSSQLPLQQSPADWHDSPVWLQPLGFVGPPLSTQTPEHA